MRTISTAVLGLLLWSCTQATPPPPAQNETGVRPVTRQLERARDASPNSGEVRAALASEYYQVARRALDARDEAQYRAYLGKAQIELIKALRVDPRDPEPHTQMGIIRAYQGDLDGAHASFTNALRLAEARTFRRSSIDGLFFTNIAHIDVYRGRFDEARRNLERGRTHDAPPSEIQRIETLLAWRSGDRAEARRIFTAALETRGFADSWDSAPLARPLASFEDFCAECCRNPSCGPFLADACQAEGQPVKQREITRETLVEEMRLERERRARLKEIYERERSLSIEIEPGSGTAPPAPGPKPAR